MDIYCTRLGCGRPINSFPDLDDITILKNVNQKYCTNCGMSLILDGRYVPLKALKRGGFGTAFLGCDRRTPAMRECVIKLLGPSANLDPEQIQKMTQLFHREAEVLEKLGTHSQIPELLAFFALQAPSSVNFPSQEFFYLVQQYIEGEDLEQELIHKSVFSEPEVLELLKNILPVLEFIHSQGSIHRDIKPSNIMRARSGLLYLIDFGAVKQVIRTGGTQSDSSVTNTVSAIPSELLTGVYTPGFAPPEQTACLAVYPSSDLYALAASCVFLLTGKRPTSLIDPKTKVWNWRSPELRVSDRLAYVLERMLADKPMERFGTAREVLDVLMESKSQYIQTPIEENSQPARASSSEWLIEVFLIGFEVGLLAITLTNLLPAAIGFGLVGLSLGSVIYAKYRRILSRKKLLILTGVTLAITLLSLSVLPSTLQIPILGLQLPKNYMSIIFFATLLGISGIALVVFLEIFLQINNRS